MKLIFDDGEMEVPRTYREITCSGAVNTAIAIARWARRSIDRRAARGSRTGEVTVAPAAGSMPAGALGNAAGSSPS